MIILNVGVLPILPDAFVITLEANLISGCVAVYLTYFTDQSTLPFILIITLHCVFNTNRVFVLDSTVIWPL
jgi:hypothetical protein